MAKQHSLLSITGLAEELVLFYLGESEGGVQTLLNLRLTCKSTKEWIDNLYPSASERVFSRARIRIKYSGDHVKEFLTSSPPFIVKSLVLDGMDHEENEEQSVEHYRNQFTSFWVRRLESLEVKVHGHILGISQIMQLMGSQKITSVKFTSSSINEEHYIAALKLMCTNPNLLYFETSLALVHLSYLGKLIEAKSYNKSFRLIVNIVGNNSFNRGVRNMLESVYIFCNILAAAKFTFVLRVQLFAHFVELLSEVESSVRKKICSSVESLTFVNNGSNEFQTLEEFPNLKELGGVRSEELEVERVSGVSLFQGLRYWPIDSLIPQSHLPHTLTSLKTSGHVKSLNELLSYLSSVAEQCPLLNNLEVECRPMSVVHNIESSITSVSFCHLKSFRFGGLFDRNDSEFVAKLMAVLGLHEMNLSHLCLTLLDSERKNLTRLDAGTVSKLLGGNIVRTLQSLDLCDDYVEFESHGLLKMLRSKVILNRRRIEQTLGRRYVFNPTYYNPYCYKQEGHSQCKNMSRKECHARSRLTNNCKVS